METNQDTKEKEGQKGLGKSSVSEDLAKDPATEKGPSTDDEPSGKVDEAEAAEKVVTGKDTGK